MIVKQKKQGWGPLKTWTYLKQRRSFFNCANEHRAIGSLCKLVYDHLSVGWAHDGKVKSKHNKDIDERFSSRWADAESESKSASD